MKVLDVVDGAVAGWDPAPDDPHVHHHYVAAAHVSNAWQPRQAPTRQIHLVSARLSRQAELARQFNELADAWERETRAESFAHRRSMHPAYQRIIGLGPAGVSLVLERMRWRQSGHWFWALNALTGEDPAAGLTKPRAAREAWIRWGIEHGHIARSS